MKKSMIALTLLACLVFGAKYRPVNAYVTMAPNYISLGKIGPEYQGVRASPGIVVGTTYMDWQYNGSCDKYIFWPTPYSAFHFYWTYMTAAGGATRRTYYNYFFPPDYWLGQTQVDALTSRMGTLDGLSDGRAVCTAHHTSGGVNLPTFYIDAAEGAGSFTITEIPLGSLPPSDAPIWPKICADTIHGRIWVSGSQSTAQVGWVTYTTNEGATWATWVNTLGGVPLDTLHFDAGGREVWVTSPNGKIALVNNDGVYLNYHYWESTDGGATWAHGYVFQQNFPSDSVLGYIWCDAVYDNNNNLHVVFVCIDTIGSGSGGSGWRSLIRHWNKATGQITPVASGWYEVTPGPGSNHPTVSEVQIGINRATGDLYVTYCKADPNDAAQNGLTNLDIYGARSTDNGVTWIEHHNITNSHTPGAPAGQCDDDRYQSLNSEVKDGNPDTLYIFYLNSKDAGGGYFPPDPGAVMTEDPYLFYAYAWNPTGVSENKSEAPRNFSLNTAPNPVHNQTSISYTLPRSGDVVVSLYGADGRLVRVIEDGYRNAGSYQVRIDTRELTSGAYLVVLKAGNQQITGKLVVAH
uniref:T9SS type A sorting domain-containing protein n=1 Tax=candidate division WOR-3 bacterium TaxID=2052148 RepID=A0A7C4THR7_UNCW3